MAEQQYHSVMDLIHDKAPSTSQVLAVVTLFPIGGILLTLSGITLAGTLACLAVVTPLFVLFSPVLVPAGILLLLAVSGFLASGAFGLTGVSSIGWIVKSVRGRGDVREQMEHAKRKMHESGGHMGQQVGQRAKDVGQGMQSKAGGDGGRT
ncbi:oleosin 18.2 kDa [Amborella trichopoda]|uniref:Oleosin n=1 Tax=Amborella trichopoda TaxID=13333 RepID=W1PGU4_AMBTC|nr:oleosin 18.2 kDa [Amborella trichopoda]ERN09207.1 hypothetical protein AMTR_s00014p00251930 [Amborella trichopoda]|eukprot:XP_020524773.1 oleosin 18.2 kDa [Amborella trichopoda]